MILKNQGRFTLNDQKISLPNEPQRSPGSVQKQPPEVFYKKKLFLKHSQISQESVIIINLQVFWSLFLINLQAFEPVTQLY